MSRVFAPGMTSEKAKRRKAARRDLFMARWYQLAAGDSNLISNSIKYRAGETPGIHVSAERDAEGWLLAVRDNGIGIDPKDTDRVFGLTNSDGSSSRTATPSRKYSSIRSGCANDRV
jgi:light-regulated signal transduction histidine kinase (bacteriophytochrome)